MKADRMSFVQHYSDGSGAEFEVIYEHVPYLHDETIIGTVTIDHVDNVTFPITKVPWLIDALQRIVNNHEVGNQ